MSGDVQPLYKSGREWPWGYHAAGGNREMNADTVDRQITFARQRLSDLCGRVGAPPQEKALINEALEELSIALHELQVTSEELREQTEALAKSREAVRAERQRYETLFNFA